MLACMVWTYGHEPQRRYEVDSGPRNFDLHDDIDAKYALSYKFSATVDSDENCIGVAS